MIWCCFELISQDYDEVAARLLATGMSAGERDGLMNAACKSRTRANAIKFSGAFNYLPLQNEPYDASDRQTPDYGSIMVSPSQDQT